MLPVPAAAIEGAHLDPRAEAQLALHDLPALALADRVLAAGAVVGRDLCRTHQLSNFNCDFVGR